MQVLLISRDQASGLGDSSEGRILLIEPDAVRARRLTQILTSHLRAELHVVSTSGEALRVMRERLPDLVLTSTFLTPSDEGLIRAHLRAAPHAAHVQIVNVPPFIDDEGSTEGPPRKVLTFLGRRPRVSACRPADVIEDITAYLEHARARRHCPATVNHAPTAFVQTAPSALADPASVPTFGPRSPDERRRARRRPTGELPWLSAVQLPWGTEVKVLDISNSGVLLESPLRLVVGSTLDLQLVGQDGQVRVAARMVRSEIAGVDGFGVRYRAAAAFARELQIPGMIVEARATAGPSALGDLLSRVMVDVDTAKPADLRARFERELRELLRVRDVQLRLTPVIESLGTDSIVFAVPHAAGPPTILQVTFQRDYQPSLMEFRLLKAAASLASVVLQFAPLEGHPVPSSGGGGSMIFRPLRPVVQSRW